MDSKNIITGQQISTVLKDRAKQLRREMTRAEQLLWQRLKANRLGGFHFRRQQIIDGYIADFYCHAAGLVVEVDGGIHLEQETYDRVRDRRMTELGLKVLRFSNSAVQNEMENVLEQILLACQSERGTV